MTIVNHRTITPPIHDPELDRRVKDAGASKTVYALVTPETEAAKNFILGNSVAGPDAARRHHLEQFRDAWTGKQFASHEAFIERWMAWAAPVVAIDAAGFRWRYPTAGGSEALFHVITAYGNRARTEKFNPEVHVFAGEYEGYKAYAEACGIAVIEHPRAEWQAVGRALPKDALFCLSQPSAIDGNVWPHANDFLALLAAEKPRVLLDVTYVGSIAEAARRAICRRQPGGAGAGVQPVKTVRGLLRPHRRRVVPERDAEPVRQSMVQESDLVAARHGAARTSRRVRSAAPLQKRSARGRDPDRPTPRSDPLAL